MARTTQSGAKVFAKGENGSRPAVTPETSTTVDSVVKKGTQVFLRLIGNGQAAANYAAKELHVSFMALLVNAGLLYDRGEVTAKGKSGDGKPVIEAGVELVNKLVAMAIAFRDSQPITVLAATGIVSAAERELQFHMEKNLQADFSSVESAIAAAREALKAVAFTKDADCRSIIESLGDVAGTCRQITLDNKVEHARDLARNAGMVEAVEAQLTEALAKPEFREKINALGVIIKTLYGCGGKTSATVAREAERQNRDNRGGGRGRNPAEPTTGRGFSKPKWQARQQGWRG